MALSRRIARYNSRYTNRFIEPVVERMPGFVTVHHRGRRTGTEFQTPLYGFSLDLSDELLVVLTYGPKADWFQNVLASGGEVERVGAKQRIESAQLMTNSAASSHLPRVVRLSLAALHVSDFARIQLAPPTNPA